MYGRRVGTDLYSAAPLVPEEAVLEEDDGEPGEVGADEDGEAPLVPGPHLRSVVADAADRGDEAEDGAVVRGKEPIRDGQPAPKVQRMAAPSQ